MLTAYLYLFYSSNLSVASNDMDINCQCAVYVNKSEVNRSVTLARIHLNHSQSTRTAAATFILTLHYQDSAMDHNALEYVVAPP